jgi:hypothetical protein
MMYSYALTLTSAGGVGQVAPLAKKNMGRELVTGRRRRRFFPSKLLISAGGNIRLAETLLVKIISYLGDRLHA